MAYAALSDVKALAPAVPITATSQPSEGSVLAWIADVERAFNASLKGIGYQTPVTGPESVAILKLIVAHAVMAMVMRARPNPEQDPENFQRRYDAFLKALRDPNDPFELPDDAIQLDTPIKGSTLRVSSNLKDLLEDDRLISRNMKF